MNLSRQPRISIQAPHTLEPGDVLSALGSSVRGLDRAEARARLDAYGPNRLPDPPKDSILYRFFKHFHDVLIYVLIAAAALTAMIGHWVDTVVILAVVVINAIIGFIQEGKAEQALQGIRKMLSMHAFVRREGQWLDVEAETLVPGDIVRLRSGDRVPADVRLTEAVNLRIEESALTGESVPASKSTAAAPLHAGVGDRCGMAHSGTLVATGRGVGVVTATGVDTEIGRINRMIAEVQTLATPLTRQMQSFSKVLSMVILAVAAGMFALGFLLHHFDWSLMLLSAIGFAVAAIPEGLPAILTITLALGVQRMARRNAITRRLNSVETLGSVTVICSDKTGTLTRNEMTARHVIAGGREYEITGTGYAPAGEIRLDGSVAKLGDHRALRDLVEVMAVANDAELVEEDGQWKVTGEPTEGALRVLALKAGFDEAGYTRLAVVPFESANKFMATLSSTPEGSLRVLLKGAPDRLLNRCTAQRSSGESVERLDRAYWEAAIDRLGAQGLRVLAAASREEPDGTDGLLPEDLERNLVFLGVVGIIDPPRPEAIEAIKTCHEAGIRVKMITGDHAGTAVAIGREMGIGTGAQAITGADLEAVSDAGLREIVKSHDIFARTSPEHKLRLVKALQANGEVVAMTGDGVNDAPALKRADVGIAMGIKGTEATKEAAEIVLADDNFLSIKHAIEEGRTIYDNLRKSILFILPTNGAESFVMLAAVGFALDLPLTPVQILWVNMVTSVTLALALAFEPSEPGLMTRPPRKPGAPILTGIFVWRIAFVSVLVGGATMASFLIELHLGMPLEVARTLAVNTLVFGEICYLFNTRFLHGFALRPRHLFTNPAAWLSVGLLFAMHLTYVYAPVMQRWFGSAPLEVRHWLIPFGIGAGVFFIVEIEKWLLQRRAR